MNCLMIITVGTSLLENDGGAKQAKTITNYLNDACTDAKKALRPGRPLIPQKFWYHRDTIFGRLESFITPDGVRSQLAYREPTRRTPDEKDRLPQELSYLALWVPHIPDGEQATVALLSSDSPDGRLCAYVITDVLRCGSEPWNKYTLLDGMPDEGFKVEGLKVEGDTKEEKEEIKDIFANKGIPHLIALFQDLCQQRTWAEVIINLTGGFKGALPYSTIAAAFFPAPKVRLHYLFENTPDIIELPSYPIGLDFPLWHRESILLEATETHRELYYQVLNERMKTIADERGRAQRFSIKNTFPDLLQNRYKSQLNTDPLQEYSERVVKQFLPEDDRSEEMSEEQEFRAELRERLLKLIRDIGPLIWMGGKLPMAAEHAQKHHHNLLELAQLLLTPIADQIVPDSNGVSRRFLNDAERFVLLSALLLHDCGHTFDALPLKGTNHLIPLFRWEIRELHHFLAYYRLGTNTVEHDLQWDPNAPLGTAVAWLCIYHRKRTGWTEEKQKPGEGYCPYLELRVPLPQHIQSTRLNLDPHDLKQQLDFPKLVALLRLIDGCDNQSRRVGRPPDRRLVEEIFNRDAETWKSRLASLVPVALLVCKEDSLSDVRHWTKAYCFLRTLHTWLVNQADSVPDFGKFDGPLWEVRRQLAVMLANSPELSPETQLCITLWLEVARAFDEYRVRANQYVHFVKHEVVQWIRLLPASDFDGKTCWSFTVTLEPNENSDLKQLLDNQEFAKKYKKEIGEDDNGNQKYETVRKWVNDEIQSELSCDSVKYLAERSGRRVKVSFKWKDQDQPFQCYQWPKTCSSNT